MIVIIGTQSYEIAGTLSSTQVPSVKVGDSAGVQVDGVDGTINGTVSQVGPVQSSESGYTYPFVVALPSSATGLFTGSTANVVIATGSVANVVAVPTSAVQTVGTRSYVTMLSNGTLTRKVIKVGMVGEIYTQVLSGLTPGQSVVLADYAEAVPSSNTDTFGGGLGGFSGAGGFGGVGGGAFRIERTTAGAVGAPPASSEAESGGRRPAPNPESPARLLVPCAGAPDAPRANTGAACRCAGRERRPKKEKEAPWRPTGATPPSSSTSSAIRSCIRTRTPTGAVSTTPGANSVTRVRPRYPASSPPPASPSSCVTPMRSRRAPTPRAGRARPTSSSPTSHCRRRTRASTSPTTACAPSPTTSRRSAHRCVASTSGTRSRT